MDPITVTGIIVGVIGYMIWFKYLVRELYGPRVWPLVGSLPDSMVNAERMHDSFAEKLRVCGGTYSTCICAIPFLAKKQGHVTVTCDPKNIEHILSTRFHNYVKGPTWRNAFHDLLGDSIIVIDGDYWSYQRKMVSLLFSNKMKRYVMDRWLKPAIVERFWPILASAQQEHKPVDLHDLLLRLSFDTTCGFAFSYDPHTLSIGLPENQFMEAFDEAADASFHRLVLPDILIKLKKWLRLGMEPTLTHSLTHLDHHLSQIINARKLNTTTQTLRDFLSVVFSSKLTDPAIVRHMSLAFILAGRDTSALGLSWFFWLCIQNPTVEEKILHELCTVLMDTRGTDVSAWLQHLLTFEEASRLVYTKAALLETLRLYPPVPEEIKYVLNDDVLPTGNFVPAGSRMVYSIYSIGRMESVWGPDCLEFKPERWLSADGCAKLDPYKCPSFNAGPRTCLGKDLAMVQMKVIVAALLLRHRFSLVPGHRVEQKMAMTLFMKNGLKVTVHPRDLTSTLDHIRSHNNNATSQP